MPSRFTQLSLLSLVSSALAAPFRPTGYSTGSGSPHGNSTGHHHHHHHHNGTAYGTGYHRHNHTRVTTTLASTSTLTVVETVYETIVPTPVESVAAQAVAADSAPAGACKARSTMTTVVTDFVTVTVQAQAVTVPSTTSTEAAEASYSVEMSSSSQAYPSFVLVSSVEKAAVVATSPKTHHHKASSSSAPAVYSSSTPAAYSSPSPAAQSSASVASAAAVSSSTPSYSGTGKRGLPYNDASLTECFVGNSKVTWAYNWGQTTSSLPSAFEYVPMIWGLNSDSTNNWFSNAKKAIASGSNHLLCFNEPDLNTQSNLSPSAAASGYKTYMQPFKQSNPSVQLGGPAVTNGGTGMGLDWLSSFITACSSCDVDFYPIHWYDSASNAAYFKSHVEQAHQLTGKPIWVTEIGATGTDAEISAFLEDVMAWMDSQDYVQRYAYFMASDGLLISGNSLSEYGKTYATA